jgi:excisionase family DNA binding protein
MTYTLNQAARRVGKGKSTLLRAVHSGKLAAIRDELTGSWLIEASELHRLYPLPVHDGAINADHGAPRTTHEPERTTPLAARIAALEVDRERERDAIRVRDEMIADLRRRLDESERERREQAARIVALLTDQRPASALLPATARRSWWHWGRR